MNIAHIALAKRSEGHAGGVPLFGHLMAKRLGAREYSWADAPFPRPKVGEPQAAQMLSAHLFESGQLSDIDAVVVDGFWGAGLPVMESLPVVTVAHNTWRAIGRAMKNSPRALELGEAQQPEYRRFPTVAVSQQVAADLAEFYSVKAAAIIHNGVDTDEFRPNPQPQRTRPLVLYPSDAPPKGGDVVAALRRMLREIDFEVIGGNLGGEAEAISRGDVLLTPSRTEGCSYARLQAMACGLPVVTSATGMFGQPADDRQRGLAVLDHLIVGTIVHEVDTRSEILVRWADKLEQALDNRAFYGDGARAWAEDYGNLDRWEQSWRTFLEGMTMATTMADITRKAGDPRPSPRGVEDQGQAPTAGDLPLDICGFCEKSLHSAFEGSSPEEPDLHKSADRKRHEDAGTEPPPAFKCRSCGQVCQRPPESVAAQVERVP